MTNDKQPTEGTLFTEENLLSLWNALEYTRATIGSGGRIESNEKPDWVVLVHRGRAHSSERFLNQAIDMVQKMRKELAS